MEFFSVQHGLDKSIPKGYAYYVPKKIHFLSLRWKIVLVVALPMFFTLAGLSYYQYNREQQALYLQLDNIAYNFGETIANSLKHIMQDRDEAMMSSVLDEISKQPGILYIALYNSRSELIATNNPGYFDVAPNRSSPGCVECHRRENPQKIRSLVIRTPSNVTALRTDIAIRNEPDCYSCHASNEDILGVLVVDFSLESLESHVAGDITFNLFLSIFVTLVASLAVYYWINIMIIRRLKIIGNPIQKFSDGDFSVRIETDIPIADEITNLQNGFNKMADELKGRLDVEHKAIDARFQAIIEERKRLARELHDSTAQVLGYVTTKSAAARLFVEKGDPDNAVSELGQLESAARSVFADLRQAIMDLNTIPEEDWDIIFVLRTYINSFASYSHIPATLIVETTNSLKLPPESYLQILRIVQEALANVRKHSNASKVDVHILVDSGNNLVILVRDNGSGFAPTVPVDDPDLHFGLSSMRERARSIGAVLEILSSLGEGTEVKLSIPLTGAQGAGQ